MTREQTLRRRIKTLTGLFILGLLLSGATAIPLQTEVNWLANATGANQLVGNLSSQSSSLRLPP